MGVDVTGIYRNTFLKIYTTQADKLNALYKKWFEPRIKLIFKQIPTQKHASHLHNRLVNERLAHEEGLRWHDEVRANIDMC